MMRLRGITRSYRWFILRWLFLVTIVSTCCLASYGVPDAVTYDDMLNMGSGMILDPLTINVHESHLVARQSNESVQLNNNAVVGMDLAPGTTDFWTFSPSRLNITDPTNSTILYITVNTCTQPFPKTGLNATEIYAKGGPPQLSLFVSTDPRNKLPGPSSDSALQNVTQFVSGFVNATLSGISSDVYLSVSALNTSSDYQGSWSYQIGTSTTGDFASFFLLT